jgi:hypothetical protein
MKIKVPPIPLDVGNDFDGKIIIIGAGVAGLSSANALKYMVRGALTAMMEDFTPLVDVVEL